MQALFRFVGVLNAAIWLGAAVVVSFVVLPLLFGASVTPGLIPKFHAGRIAELVLNRYLTLQLVCACIALIHLLGERRQQMRAQGKVLNAGRPAGRKPVFVLLGLLLLGCLGAFWLAPKMERLHLEKYATNRTPEQLSAAGRQFAAWHGVSQAANLVMLAGILFHFWRTVGSPVPTRPASPFQRGA